MGTSATPAAWHGLEHPALAQLLRFNQLPSLLLHPQQIPGLAPPEGWGSPLAQRPGVLAALHKRWSARLLQGLGNAAAPVLDMKLPALPLALADAGLLARLARALGLALLARELRRVIVRDEVLALRQALGAQELQRLLDEDVQVQPELDDAQRWLAHGWTAGPELLGFSVLARAWQDAPAPLARRADWRLPPLSLSAQARADLPLSASQARGLCLHRLEQMDPAWLSCFTATH
ncbi:hypothetical protein [Comamonas sp. NLF-1-9]|uniref:hypothetical protein n=1 Tax=Comamonas sp. NLF-1-9 TaxID=2853163 RepID=UPI001C445EAF|nr:hypothetical protein [Comamonas sp. NLF-1-9]QXL83625.1 hypothetical protein KUD94_10235 [Comamonas sp. NLF-1-9]